MVRRASKRRKQQPCDCCPPGCTCGDCEMCSSPPPFVDRPEANP